MASLVGAAVIGGIIVFLVERQRQKVASGSDTKKSTNPGFDLSDRQKMVLLVRCDLKMTTGKMCAQCGHASVGAVKSAMKRQPDVEKSWENDAGAKIALKVNSEEELVKFQAEAVQKGLITYLVVDAGRTQIAPNSKTVLAIGPGPAKVIDSITGQLKLL